MEPSPIGATCFTKSVITLKEHVLMLESVIVTENIVVVQNIDVCGNVTVVNGSCLNVHLPIVCGSCAAF